LAQVQWHEVTGDVDAENSFAAMARTSWIYVGVTGGSANVPLDEQ
jgi:hypothetical protein